MQLVEYRQKMKCKLLFFVQAKMFFLLQLTDRWNDEKQIEAW